MKKNIHKIAIFFICLLGTTLNQLKLDQTSIKYDSLQKINNCQIGFSTQKGFKFCVTTEKKITTTENESSIFEFKLSKLAVSCSRNLCVGINQDEDSFKIFIQYQEKLVFFDNNYKILKTEKHPNGVKINNLKFIKKTDYLLLGHLKGITIFDLSSRPKFYQKNLGVSYFENENLCYAFHISNTREILVKALEKNSVEIFDLTTLSLELSFSDTSGNRKNTPMILTFEKYVIYSQKNLELYDKKNNYEKLDSLEFGLEENKVKISMTKFYESDSFIITYSDNNSEHAGFTMAIIQISESGTFSEIFNGFSEMKSFFLDSVDHQMWGSNEEGLHLLILKSNFFCHKNCEECTDSLTVSFSRGCISCSKTAQVSKINDFCLKNLNSKTEEKELKINGEFMDYQDEKLKNRESDIKKSKSKSISFTKKRNSTSSQGGEGVELGLVGTIIFFLILGVCCCVICNTYLESYNRNLRPGETFCQNECGCCGGCCISLSKCCEKCCVKMLGKCEKSCQYCCRCRCFVDCYECCCKSFKSVCKCKWISDLSNCCCQKIKNCCKSCRSFCGVNFKGCEDLCCKCLCLRSCCEGCCKHYKQQNKTKIAPICQKGKSSVVLNYELNKQQIRNRGS